MSVRSTYDLEYVWFMTSLTLQIGFTYIYHVTLQVKSNIWLHKNILWITVAKFSIWHKDELELPRLKPSTELSEITQWFTKVTTKGEGSTKQTYTECYKYSMERLIQNRGSSIHRMIYKQNTTQTLKEWYCGFK